MYLSLVSLGRASYLYLRTPVSPLSNRYVAGYPKKSRTVECNVRSNQREEYDRLIHEIYTGQSNELKGNEKYPPVRTYVLSPVSSGEDDVNRAALKRSLVDPRRWNYSMYHGVVRYYSTGPSSLGQLATKGTRPKKEYISNLKSEIKHYCN